MWSIAEALKPARWIEQEAFDRILTDTIGVFAGRKKSPRDYSFERDFPAPLRRAAHLFLDDTIGTAMQAHFLQGYGFDVEAFRRNAAGALRYFEEIDRLRELGFEHYETVSNDLMMQLRDMVSGRLDIGTKDPPHRSRQHWERAFFPDTLGLFFGLFGEAPTASIATESRSTRGTNDNALPSPAFEFVSELILEVDGSEAAVRLRTIARGHQIDLPEWNYRSETALRNKIATWKKHPRKEPLEGKRWMVIGQEFARSFYQFRN